MNTRLYYPDSYLTQFKTTIETRLTYLDHPAVILEQSAFYPTGGGQPHDLGTLNDVALVDVVTDSDSGAVIHLLEADIAQNEVVGQINWPRRFDLMQQHSGQHILSQAILSLTDAETVGFHLSQDYATLDLSRPDLSPLELTQAETLANQILHENRSITARFVTTAELTTIPLRKKPTVAGLIRVVEVADFDWSACGGTHVANTGEVGLIKIIKSERRKRLTRLTFLCGQRALVYFQMINQQIRDMALHLSVSVEETGVALQQQRDQLRQAHKDCEQLHQQLIAYQITDLVAQSSNIGPVSIVSQVFTDQNLTTVRQLTLQIIKQENRIVLFGLCGEKGQLLFARSENLLLDMHTLLTQVGPIIGGGGGGSSQFAQGGGSRPQRVAEAISAALTLVTAQLKS